MNITKNPIFYITRDRERGEGRPEGSDYSIVSINGVANTYDLLQLKEVEKKINESGARIVVFKNNSQIEKLAEKKGWQLLNPSSELAEQIENKITQEKFLGKLASYFPPHEITLTKNIKWNKKPLILQWAHGHTGEGTKLIKEEKELIDLKQKFPDRDARVSEYIHGPVFTLNVVIAKENILVGNISYQITGISPFTDNPMSTIGNDWSLPHTLLPESKILEINLIANKVAEKLKENKWKGLFGIDFIYDEGQDTVFLLEINARQPASATYESKLQSDLRKNKIQGLTIFEAHLEALADQSSNLKLIDINDGAQIIQRVTSTTTSVSTKKIEDAGYNVIKYGNIKLNSDLVRIQSTRGIMESHGIFNKRGKEILSFLTQK